MLEWLMADFMPTVSFILSLLTGSSGVILLNQCALTLLEIRLALQIGN